MTPRRSEPAIVVDWDVSIQMDDELILRADIFRPDHGEPCPAIVAYGPYAKGLTIPDGNPDARRALIEAHPEDEAASSNR